MRRLPVFFVIDCSESMVGKPLEAVQEGIDRGGPTCLNN